MPDVITSNIRLIAFVATALISLGMGWTELTHRINEKAEQVELIGLQARMEQAEARSLREAGINRILLCRLPEIRPDSYCEGLR